MPSPPPPYATLYGEDAAPRLHDEDGNAVDVTSFALLAPRRDVQADVANEGHQDVSLWGTKDVSDWLGTIGMGSYAEAFRVHEITGRQLHRLTEAHMIEMGMNKIGFRIALRLEIAKLHSEMSDALEETVIWSASAAKSYHGMCDYWYKKHVRPCVRKITFQKPGFLDEYKMTTSMLVVTQRERTISDVCCGGRQVRTTTRHVQLESITSATATTASATTCDFGEADLITIELDRARMLRPIQPLAVSKGDGADVVQRIMDAVHKRKIALSEGLGASQQVMVR